MRFMFIAKHRRVEAEQVMIRGIIIPPNAEHRTRSGRRPRALSAPRGFRPVVLMCGTLGVSRSVFHAWLNRATVAACPRRRDDRRQGEGQSHHQLPHIRRAPGLARSSRRTHFLRPASGRTADASAGSASAATAPWAAEGSRRMFGHRWQYARSPVHGGKAEPEMGGRLHLYTDRRRMALCCRGDRHVLAPGGWLVDERHDDRPARHRRADHGESGGVANPMPCCTTRSRVAKADSTGRCNTSTEEVVIGIRKRRSDRCGRPPLRSPGWPPAPTRSERQLFWVLVATGATCWYFSIIFGSGSQIPNSRCALLRQILTRSAPLIGAVSMR